VRQAQSVLKVPLANKVLRGPQVLRGFQVPPEPQVLKDKLVLKARLGLVIQDRQVLPDHRAKPVPKVLLAKLDLKVRQEQQVQQDLPEQQEHRALKDLPALKAFVELLVFRAYKGRRARKVPQGLPGLLELLVPQGRLVLKEKLALRVLPDQVIQDQQDQQVPKAKLAHKVPQVPKALLALSDLLAQQDLHDRREKLALPVQLDLKVVLVLREPLGPLDR